MSIFLEVAIYGNTLFTSFCTVYKPGGSDRNHVVSHSAIILVPSSKRHNQVAILEAHPNCVLSAQDVDYSFYAVLFFGA